jgi:hypothetical protein
MTQESPVPLGHIAKLEGMHERAVRDIVKELETEHNIEYMNVASKASPDTLAPGLTTATSALRMNLGTELYTLRERGNDSADFARNEIAPRVGLNPRQQARAEQRPFNHDWTLSQIERLAKERGRHPVEFLLNMLSK